jgi:hypothetical protein
MPQDIIQLPPDSTGKKVAARSYTEGANTVYAQGGFITTDVAGGNPVEVKNVLPGADSYGLNVRTTNDNIATLFYDQVEGAALNTNLWTGANVTQTITQSAGFINLNASAITTTTTSSSITSVKSMPRFGYFPMVLRMGLKVTNPTATNQTMEWGFGVISGAAAPTDGAFFRQDSTGIKAVINFAGAETLSSALTALTAGQVTIFEIHLIGRKAIFVIDGTVVATLTATAANSGITSADRLPIFARVKNTGAASAAPGMSLSRITVLQTDLDWGKSWADEISDSQSRGSFASPVSTFGQTANWANSAAPTTATLSNTAASYTTLGGYAAIPGTVGAATDFALFGYQVPAGYELHITGVQIAGGVLTGAAMGTTATAYIWALGVNSSAVSLATADALGPPPTAWAPRRIALGSQGMVASAAIGTVMTPALVHTFGTPVIVDSGRFVHVILRILSGVATASTIINVAVTINGYFE